MGGGGRGETLREGAGASEGRKKEGEVWGKGARGPCPGKFGWGGLRDSEQKGSQVGLTCSGGAAAGVDGPGSTAGPGRAACVPGTASACRSFLLLNAAFKPRHRFSARCLFFLSVSSSRSTAAMQVVSALNLNRAWGEGRKVDGSAGERGRELERAREERKRERCGGRELEGPARGRVGGGA